MNVDAVTSRTPAPRVALIFTLCALAAVLLWFVTQKVHFFTDFSPASYGDYYWPRRFGLIAHLTGGSLAISVGLVQIWLGLTHRANALHRALGKLYGIGMLLGSVGGFYLALTIKNHLAYSAGLFMMSVAWVLTTSMAIYAIRARRIDQHREWMLRSYTVTFAFVTYRFASTWMERWISVPADPHADDIDTLLAWASWAVPLLFAEALIQLQRIRLSRRSAA